MKVRGDTSSWIMTAVGFKMFFDKYGKEEEEDMGEGGRLQRRDDGGNGK